MKLRHFFALSMLLLLNSHAETASAQASGETVDYGLPRSEWYTVSAGSYRERYSWQHDRGFLNGIVYQLGLYVYDVKTYGCQQSLDLDPVGRSCLAPMQRCPFTSSTKDPATPGTLTTFLKAFEPYGYCSDPDELQGRVPQTIKDTKLYQTSFEQNTDEYAAFQESYAAVPLALRRTIHSMTKNLWSNMTCSEFNAKKNIVSTRKVEAPVLNYDCAIYQKRLNGQPADVNLTQGVPFLPRDRGIYGKCVSRQHIFFTGPNCTGTPLALVRTDRVNKDLSFIRVRSPGELEAGRDPEMVAEPPTYQDGATFVHFPLSADGSVRYDVPILREYRLRDFNPGTNPVDAAREPLHTPGVSPSQVARAYYTDILDKTIYYAYNNESFRRTVSFVNQPGVVTGVTDMPYIKALEDRSVIRSYYADGDSDFSRFTPSAPYLETPNCVNVSNPAASAIPDGYFGYLDAVEGMVNRYSGVILNHYRDRTIELDGIPAASREPYRQALLDHQYLLGARDGACRPNPVASLPFSDPTLPPEGQPYLITSVYPMTKSTHRRLATDPFLAMDPDKCPSTPTPTVPPPPVFNPDTVADTRFQSRLIREWWSESPRSDKTGFYQALSCRPDEVLIGLGRNNENFSIYSNPAKGTLGAPERYCMRYLFGQEARTDDDGKYLYSDVGSLLPEMASSQKGVVAGAMMCEGDPFVVAAPASSLLRMRIETADPLVLDERDYSASIPAGTFMDVMASKGAAPGVLKAFAATSDPATNEFLNNLYPDGSALLTIPARAYKLGYPDAEIDGYLPKNYGYCARFKSLPEHRNYLFGPLSTPVRNYIMLLLTRNVNDIPSGKPPKCPAP